MTESIDFLNVSSFVLYSSPESLFVVNVDDLFSTEIKEYFLTQDLCVNYHDTEKLSLKFVVFNKKFKLIFKSNNDIFNFTSPLITNFLKIYVKICFSKRFTVFGQHRKGLNDYNFVEHDLNHLSFPS